MQRSELLYTAICNHAENENTNRFYYETEWLGYLPFGQYHWITCGKSDVREGLPVDWEESDLQALVNSGHLKVIEVYRNPDDNTHRRIDYEICDK